MTMTPQTETLPPAAPINHREVRPPFLGFGMGLRSEHYQDILEGDPPIDWFEVVSENFMVPGGKPLQILDQIAERYPVVMHGVSMSIASTQELDMDYLSQLKTLAARVHPQWISDHLCWTGVHGINLHDLLPFPYTKEALNHIADRVNKVQDYLNAPLALENVSTYVSFDQSEMSEWDFISELTKRTGCWLLLDVNNVFVSAFNHEFDALEFINGIPKDRVIQFHMAGHSDHETYIVDTHDAPVRDEVWELYRACMKRFGHVSTIIERDDNIPPLAELMPELQKIRDIAVDVHPELAPIASRHQPA